METFLNGRVTQYCGDVRAELAKLRSNDFDCVVTSPPFWGLRDYGFTGQLGLEPTLGEHIDTMVDVFAEVRRVLKPSGTLWLNYGDCYATIPNGRSAEDTKSAGNDDRTFRDKPFSTVGPLRAGRSNNLGNTAGDGVRRNIAAQGYLKPGDLCMVPNRIAIALQDSGWWVKAECVWAKRNPMPDSSGVYRPSSAHEKIWLLAKSNDCELWRARDTGDLSTAPDLTERCALRGDADRDGCRWIRMPFYYDAGAGKQEAVYANSGRASATKAQLSPDRKRNGHDKQGATSRRHAGFNDRWNIQQAASFRAVVENRLLRNYEPAPLTVWPMATDPFPGAHFATFPFELVERCILVGCPAGGNVLDPFGGTGTTALVAASLGRTCTLIDANPDYCAMARARIEAAFMGKDEGRFHVVKASGQTADAGPLFTGMTI